MTRRDPFEDGRVRIEAMVHPLIEGGVLAPLADRDDDAQLWIDCDLCSFVENRRHHRLEPEALTADQRAAWARLALAADERLRDPRRSDFTAAFWLLDRGVRAGTIALSKATYGRQFLPVFSLYVFPAHRSTGLAYRALRAVDQASVSAGFAGIRVATYWTWQAAVRRYLFRYGMWAWSFKRSIDFVWADLPPHTITVDHPTARFAIERDARTLELITAARDGELLIWNESPAMASSELDRMVQSHARSTFAVALAVHGWPLLRSGDDLDDAAVYDLGGPDVLAAKIGIFEALDRRSGFDVRTPRIPGLPYDAIAQKLSD
ncbi:MAG TPA: hypothetical protein VF469_12825 [Kofleriaceae bacterium]